MTTSPPILPRALRPGATVGVIAPSAPPGAEKLERTTAYWSGRGHPVRLGEHVEATLGGYLAGPAEARAADLNAMLRDPAVGLVVAAMAGKGASHLLDLIDHDALRADPKPVIGLSDVSLLVLALHARTGVVTFHGPTGMEFGRMPEYSEGAMLRALQEPAALGTLPVPDGVEWRTLRGGAGPVEGPLLGGHLGTIRALIGSAYEPDWDGAVLFVEEVDCEHHDVDAALTHFRLAGVLDRIAALVVGRPLRVEERYWTTDEPLDAVILRCCAGHAFPIVTDVDLGHGDDKLTLPVGVAARVDPATASLTVLAPATRA